jgi:hypothetical protein
MVAQVGYSVAGRSRGRVASCAVCTWHVETRSAGFLVVLQNQGGVEFPGLGLKITATVSWFGTQNHVGFSLSVALQNRRREVGAGHASRSSSLLGVEASLARVFQSDLKTGADATTGGARGTTVEVASEAN